MRTKIYSLFVLLFAVLLCTTGKVSAQCTENFDGVTAPALPAGWIAFTSTAGAGSTAWVTNTTTPQSAPNSAFTNNPGVISDEWLTSPSMPIFSTTSVMTFQ